MVACMAGVALSEALLGSVVPRATGLQATESVCVTLHSGGLEHILHVSDLMSVHAGVVLHFSVAIAAFPAKGTRH